MKRHIHTVHEGNKDHKCDDCGKIFSSLQVLEKHLHRVHDGYKDHKCESCDKSFSQAGNLKTHIHIIHDTTNVTYATKHNRRHKLVQ